MYIYLLIIITYKKNYSDRLNYRKKQEQIILA